MTPPWTPLPPELTDPRPLADAVLKVHQDIHERHFRQDPVANDALGLQIRACRRVDQWQALLLLTPWMLSRLWFPDEPPDIDIPPEWHADARGDDYQLLGPAVEFDVLGQRQQAHLNYHPALGHYLLQPLALNMRPYHSTEEAFEAWNHVIRVRDENMRKAARDCPLQKEISRREFFRRFRG